MNWVQTLIIAAVPAIVTAVALLLQERSTNNRAGEVAAAQRRDVQLEALSAAHTEMLLALNDYWQQIEPLFAGLATESAQPAALPRDTVVPAPDTRAINVAATALVLLARDDELVAASEARAAVESTRSLLVHLVEVGPRDVLTAGTVRGHRVGAVRAIDTYGKIARDGLAARRLAQPAPPASRRR